MSDTPRTDAAAHEQVPTYANEESWIRAWGEMRNFAATLERELAEVAKQRDELAKALKRNANQKLESEWDGKSDWNDGDFEGAYESMVRDAREALAAMKGGGK